MININFFFFFLLKQFIRFVCAFICCWSPKPSQVSLSEYVIISGQYPYKHRAVQMGSQEGGEEFYLLNLMCT